MVLASLPIRIRGLSLSIPSKIIAAALSGDIFSTALSKLVTAFFPSSLFFVLPRREFLAILVLIPPGCTVDIFTFVRKSSNFRTSEKDVYEAIEIVVGEGRKMHAQLQQHDVK